LVLEWAMLLALEWVQQLVSRLVLDWVRRKAQQWAWELAHSLVGWLVPSSVCLTALGWEW